MVVDDKSVQNDPAQKEIKFILELFNSNKLDEVKKEIDRQLIRYPNSSILYNILGAVLTSQNEFEEALKNYNKSIKNDPNYVQAYNNLGVCFYKLSRIDEAIKNYQKAIEIKPNHADAYNNLGAAFKELGQHEKSLKCYQKAIEIEPNHAGAHNNLGAAFTEMGEHEKSLKCYQKAIEIEPNHADAHNNLGTEFKRLKEYNKSIYHYEKTISIKPSSSVAYSNLGNIHKAMGQYDEALDWYQKAIQTDPNYSDSYYNVGTLFDELNEFEQSKENYNKAIKIQSNHTGANTNLLFNICWSNNDKEYLKTAKRYYHAIKKPEEKQLINIKTHSEKILNIGFISGDFRNHSVAFFLLDTLKYIKKEKLKLFAYYNNTIEDNVTKLIRDCFDKWEPVFYKPDKDLINLIRKDKIDILIDLSGHTSNNRLTIFKSRCAPTQVTWCGWLASTGIKEIDYIIGDKYATHTSNQNNFSEKIYQMKKIWQCYSTSESLSMPVAIKKSNEKYIIFGSFVNNMKINENVIDAWSKILNGVPDSKLFLKCSSFSIPQARENFIRKINKKINKSQLIIEGKSSRSEYLDSYNKIDIVLDTFPSSGATTSFEASYMGVPILTKTSEENFWFRSGESININLNMNDWIAKNENDYVEKAIKFSEKKKYLVNLKEEIRNFALKSPLFNTKNYSEDFYEMLLNIKK